MEAASNELAAAGDHEVTHSPLEFAEWRQRRRPLSHEKVRHNGGTWRFCQTEVPGAGGELVLSVTAPPGR